MALELTLEVVECSRQELSPKRRQELADAKRVEVDEVPLHIARVVLELPYRAEDQEAATVIILVPWAEAPNWPAGVLVPVVFGHAFRDLEALTPDIRENLEGPR